MIDHGTVFMPHLLELLLMVLFLHFCRPRMSVRVVNHGALPVRLLDLLLVSVLIHSKNFVVVLPLRLLQFQFGLL